MSIEKHSLTSVVFTDEGNTGEWQPSLGDGYMGAHHDRSTLLHSGNVYNKNLGRF